ncbi:hypothetical protein [Haloprofundus halophilus]|uniref:hypothetical protein n=1 Tax=Haloprofundus halophilus TaxID=2283527 RepID=UPI001300A08B|nr:hypothetical protein [Haloprofundus halophilus]
MHNRTKCALLVGLLILVVDPVAAQSGENGGGALGDVIVAAIQEALKTLFAPIEGIIEEHAGNLVETVVDTPAPDAVFDEPTNGPWPGLYDYYWNAIIPLSLFLWGLSIGLVIFFETTSNLFSGYHRSKLKKRAFTGLLGILSWWWIDAISRQLIQNLSVYLIPDLSNVSLFQTLSFSAMGVLGLVVTLSTDFVLFVLIALIYFIRHVTLYLFTLFMPILIAFWIPGVGPFSLVSGFMKRLAGFYVPFLFMTVPVALLFRIGEIMGSSFELSMGGIGAWLTALVIPIVAVVSPFVLFWQAGALFFMTDRMAQRVSTQRARTRVNQTIQTGRGGAQGGQNFMRGARGRPAIRADGQTMLNSGHSRAHATGSRLSASGSQLRRRLSGASDRNSEASPTRSKRTSRSDSPSGDGRGGRFENRRKSKRRTSSRSPESSEAENRKQRRPDDRPDEKP